MFAAMESLQSDFKKNMSLLCNDINITMVTKARDILTRFDQFSQEIASDLAHIADSV